MKLDGCSMAANACQPALAHLCPLSTQAVPADVACCLALSVKQAHLSVPTELQAGGAMESATAGSLRLCCMAHSSRLTSLS